MPAPLPRPLRRRVLDLYRGGYTIREAARRTGVAYNTAHAWVQKAGLTRSRRWASRRGASARRGRDYFELRERALRLYRRGLPGGAVADVLGVSLSTVRKWLRAAGVTRSRVEANRLAHALDPARVTAACRMRAAGVPRAEVAARFGVDKSTISAWAASPLNPYRNAA